MGGYTKRQRREADPVGAALPALDLKPAEGDERAGKGTIAVPTGTFAVEIGGGRSGQDELVFRMGRGWDGSPQRGLLFGWYDNPIVGSPRRVRVRSGINEIETVPPGVQHSS